MQQKRTDTIVSVLFLLQFFKKTDEIIRQSTLKVQFLARNRMNKSDAASVQTLSIEVFTNLRLLRCTIYRITSHGMTEMCHMHANLMGSSRL